MKSRYLTILIIFSIFLVFKSNTQNVVRGPYLQLVTPHSIIIRWRTELPADSKVWYGSSPDELTSTKYLSGKRTEHEINITGLFPNTTYFYAVGDSLTQLAGGDKDHYFTTSPPHGTPHPVSIWVLGDAGKKTNRQRAVRNAFYRFNGGLHTDLILLLGDNAYDDGTDAEFQEAWFENMYEESLVNSVMWPTAGNHDVHSADSRAGTGPYYDIFNCPKNGEAGGVPSGTEAYYSFDYANIHFISLNTEDIDHTEASPMLAWLKKDIDSTSQDWIVAFFHKPPYYDFVEDFRKNFLPVLEAGGVDLVLYGHRHHYSRSFLMNGHYGEEGTFDTTSMVVNLGDGRPDGDGAYEKPLGITPNAGTIYLNTGSAGVASHDITNFPFLPWEIGPPVMGSTHISVSGRQMDVKFISHGGNVRDHFTIHKVSGNRPAVNLISPVDGTAYPAVDTLAIAAEASDPDGQVTLVEFFANGASIGTDSSAPFSLDWNVPAEDIYDIHAVATDDGGNAAQTQKVTIEVGISTRCAGIALSSDDAEQTISDGDMSLTSSDLELCDEEETQIIGLRFQQLRIPPKAQIVRAHIQFTADEASNLDPCRLDIYGEASADPGTFTDTLNDLADRPRTKAFVSWTPNYWVEIDDAEPSQQTPDIQPVIQEIVNQEGYTSISPIAIIIEGSGQRVAKSYDKDPAKAAKLCVIYKTHDTGFDCPALEAIIGDPCDDNDPDTANDVIQEDCSCSGDLPDADGDGTPDPADECNGGPEPGTSCDDGNPNTIRDVIASDCICRGVPIPKSGVLDIQIDSSSDDAEERSDSGLISLNSSDLELVMAEPHLQVVGVRFNDIRVPPGAMITNAYIQFSADDISTDTASLVIRGEASDNAGTFIDNAADISTRPVTDTAVAWSPPDWTAEGESGLAQQTPDIAPIIREIVARPGWNAGHSMAFTISGSGVRSAVAYDGLPGKAPILHIEYNLDENCPEAGAPCDDGDPSTFDDREDGHCHCAGTPEMETGSTALQVNNSNDDAEEKVENGQINLTSSDLELTYNNNGAQIAGIRFNDIPIQQSAPVDKAYIQFTTDEISTGVSEVIIWGEAADHAAAFTGTDYDVSSRTRTSALVNWTIPDWLIVGEAGAGQQTPDLSPVVEEITGRPGWSAGNSLAFFIEGNGTKSAVSYDGSAGDAPKLIIEYPQETSDSLAIKALQNSSSPLEYNDRTTQTAHSKIEVFPNPVGQQLNIRTRLHTAPRDESASLIIYHFDGKTIIQQEQIPLDGRWIEHRLDVSQLRSGLYFLSLDTGRMILTERFIKIGN